MKAAVQFATQVFATLRRQRRALLAFHLFFSVLVAGILLPATGWIMTAVLTRSGERAISNYAIVDFMLSPVGLLWGLTGATLLLLVINLQRAGMIVICAEHHGTPSRQVVTAFVHVVRKFPRLFRLSLIRASAHVLLAAPFLLCIYLLHDALLGGYENDFVMRTKPAALWLFLAASLPFAVAIVVLNGTLYIRWLLALPCVMLEHMSALGALRRSHRLARGWRWRLLLTVATLASALLALPAVLAFVFDNLALLALDLLPDRFAILIPATIAVIALYTLFAIVLTFLATGVSAAFLHVAHARAAGRDREPLAATRARRAGLLSWSIELLLILFSLWQAVQVMEHFHFTDDVAVIAHRGSSMTAPENSIAAIEQAIADSADYVEIDVRASADGTPVLMHDRDLLRVAGDARAVNALDVAELSRIDIGRRVGARYAGETVPTLRAVAEQVSGRVIPLVDIKSTEAAVLHAVIAVLDETGTLDAALIGASSPAVLREIRTLAPATRTALFIHFSIGAAASTGFDVLAVRSSAVTPEFILDAHRRGHEVFVFTVNGRAQMSRFIDMGVDGIITDRPALLHELLAERAALSEGELLVVKLRHWLRE